MEFAVTQQVPPPQLSIDGDPTGHTLLDGLLLAEHGFKMNAVSERCSRNNTSKNRVVDAKWQRSVPALISCCSPRSLFLRSATAASSNKQALQKTLARNEGSSTMLFDNSDLLMSGSHLKLSALLCSKDMLREFLRFLQVQHAAENLLFFLAAEAFARVFDEERMATLAVPVSGVSMLQEAREIHSRFLRDDAPKWVCVTPDALSVVDEALKDDGRELHYAVFNAAQEESKQTLERDCIPRFIKCVLEYKHRQVPGFPVNKALARQIIQILK